MKSPKQRIFDDYEMNQVLDNTDFSPHPLEDLEFYEWIVGQTIKDYYQKQGNVSQEEFNMAQRARVLICHIKHMQGEKNVLS